MGLLRFAARRLATLLATLVLVAGLGFVLVMTLPGDPVSAREDLAHARQLSPTDIDRLRAAYGLDLPALVNTDAEGLGLFTQTRFARWLGRLARFDFGEAHDGRAVSTLIGEALPVTLLLGLCALLCAYVIALPLGGLAGARPGGPWDSISSWGTVLALSLPAPWVVVLVVSSVAALPGATWPLRGLTSADAASWGFVARALDVAAHLALPVACLAYGSAAMLLRLQRASVAEAWSSDFVRGARARGVHERRLVWRHAMRPTLATPLALLAVELPWVLSGSVVVEAAFDLPGVGLLTARALAVRDYPTLLGVTMSLAVVAALAGALADVLAAWADPRLREGES